MPGRLPNHGFREVSFRTTGSGKVPGQVPGLLGIIPRLILFYRCKGGKKTKNILWQAELLREIHFLAGPRFAHIEQSFSRQVIICSI